MEKNFASCGFFVLTVLFAAFYLLPGMQDQAVARGITNSNGKFSIQLPEGSTYLVKIKGISALRLPDTPIM